MHVMITGAGGFVGAALVRRLLAGAGPAIARLTLIDRHFASPPEHPLVRAITGDFGADDVLDTVFAAPVDLVFHLASVPGGQAEREFGLGYAVNLLAPLKLFERAAGQARAPRVVYASSIAVYGGILPDPVDHATPARPGTSYGAHKLVSEIVLADLSRRELVDGVSLRLPGIVARPGLSAGHGSAFMSAIMRAAQAGSAYVCPVSPAASCWWMSLDSCVDNLLHAAGALDTLAMNPERVVTLPVLRHTVGEVLAALSRRFGAAAVAGISHAPDASIESIFGRMPRLDCAVALELGLSHDGNIDRLIERAAGPSGAVPVPPNPG